MASDDFVPFADMMGEEGNTLPLLGMLYLRYIGEDGESYFKWHFVGNQPLSVTLGDLDRIKFELMADDHAEGYTE